MKPAGTDRIASRADRPPRVRGRLFRKYVILFVAVVCVVLLANGLLEIWFSYQDHKNSLIRIQQEQAESAAAKLGEFIDEIESQVGWTTQLSWTSNTLEQRRFDALRLLRQVPAITELALLDSAGKERLRVSRIAMDVVGSNLDFSRSPEFTEAMAHKVYYGPIYFRHESEPYMTLALAGTQRESGVSVAEVNLKLMWDVVSQIKVGRHGVAYVVDRQGRLIAHPDISLVLRNTDMSQLAQVRAARRAADDGGGDPVQIADDVHGREVLTTYAVAAPMGWLVFVELPVAEAYGPLYASILRSSALLLAALGLAGLAGLLLARRMVGPILALRAGASRIGSGDFAQRISIKTGDELEILADQFNDMGSRLQQSYADLEKKVEARTRQLEVASQHKSQFLANVSHELRTPLNAILGYTELVLDDIYGQVPGKIRDVLKRVQTNGQHLLGLINDVLDLSKIEAGQMALSVTPYSLEDILHGVVAAVEPLAAEKRLKLTLDVAPSLPMGHGDDRRIAQVLLNLVGNAIKFTDRGEVGIIASAENGFFRIAVRDTGPGISQADQQKVFDEFYQVDDSSTKAKGGTGLGLAIAKQIIEMHGGRISLESKLGKGSTFAISLPVTIEPQMERL